MTDKWWLLVTMTVWWLVIVITLDRIARALEILAGVTR